ncbi:MAG: hemagglutinin repeat-containing protein, partial [Mariniblastus sp.]|nr:hemagglutinin repeat-containing protein [Mariniblastus sp.]
EGSLFYDLDSISGGAEFANVLLKSIVEVKVVLVVIGSTWHTVTDVEEKRRLLDPEDWVRQELLTAHKSQKRPKMIPVLVGANWEEVCDFLETRCPELSFLPGLNYRDFSDPQYFESSLKLLLRDLEQAGVEIREPKTEPISEPQTSPSTTYTNKNTVIGSTISAGGNVHVGDVVTTTTTIKGSHVEGHVQGDVVAGDKVEGDKIMGDKIVQNRTGLLMAVAILVTLLAGFAIYKWNQSRQPAASKKMANGNSNFIETDVRIFPKIFIMTRRKQRAALLPMPTADRPSVTNRRQTVLTQGENC